MIIGASRVGEGELAIPDNPPPVETDIPAFGWQCADWDEGTCLIPTLLNGLTEATMTAWIQRFDPTHRLGVGASRSFGNNDYQCVYTTTSGRIVTTARNPNSGRFLINSGNTSSDWVHVAWTYDGTGTPVQKLYKNGAFAQQAAADTPLTTLPTNMYWGGSYNEQDGSPVVLSNSKGRICDVRIYDRTLAADEVQDIYDYKHVADGLVGWYMTENNNLTDSSGNNNHGTVFGNAPTFLTAGPRAGV